MEYMRIFIKMKMGTVIFKSVTLSPLCFSIFILEFIVCMYFVRKVLNMEHYNFYSNIL